MPKKCVDVGWETLRDQFQRLVQQDAQAKDHDTIFDPVKTAVVEQAMNHHVWDKKASDYLVRLDFTFSQLRRGSGIYV